RPQMQGLAAVPPGLIGEGWPALRSFPLLCLAYVVHVLLHLIVSLLHSFAPRGLHDVRLAAWSAASKASCSQEPRYKTSLMKKVGCLALHCVHPLPHPPRCGRESLGRPERLRPAASASRLATCLANTAARCRGASKMVVIKRTDRWPLPLPPGQ